MATYGLFNNSEENTEAEFLRTETSFLARSGVIDLDGGDFEVTADGSTLNAYIASGESRILNSSWSKNSGLTKFFQTENTAPVTVSVSANSDGNPRIASIFQFFNASADPTTRGQNAIEYKEVTGTAAASPTAPAAPSDGNSYLRFANITVSNGASSISNSDISDQRTTSVISNEGIGLDFRYGEGGSTTTSETPKIEAGWDFITGNSTDTLTKSVTFNSAFDEAPVVTAVIGGSRSTGAGTPTSNAFFTDPGIASSASFDISIEDVTTTGFTVRMTRTGGSYSGSVNYSFNYTAIAAQP
jgi:hypothetical protein